MEHNASGITIKRNASGIPRYVQIDLLKHGAELKNFLASKEIYLFVQFS